VTSPAFGEIKLCSGDVPCPATTPGQSQPRLLVLTSGLELSKACDPMSPKPWAISKPDSGLAACSRSRGEKERHAAVKSM